MARGPASIWESDGIAKDAYPSGGFTLSSLFSVIGRPLVAQPLTLTVGMKYRGFHLEGEYYFRWVDDFKTIGTIPVTELSNHGFSLQASAMLLPRVLQPYVTYSKIYGEYGDPWELALGMNIYRFTRKETRFNLQAAKLNRSPIGGSSLAQVGGSGWVFNADWILNF